MRLPRYSLALCAAFPALMLSLWAGRVPAQEAPPGAQADPPARVARLSFLYGSVSFQPAGESGWVAAVPNRPLTSGDSLWVDTGARAEMHVGSTAIRLGQGTSVTLLEVSDRIMQIRLAQGSLILNARHVDDGEVLETDAPNLAFSALAPGEYRIDVNADGTETSTAVWRGEGRVNGSGREYTVVAGQQAHFTGLDSLVYEISPVPGPDPFDNWAIDRDRREDRANPNNYVSREVTGYEDLDAQGQWNVVAGYGPVWSPVGVPAGWAPYRFGQWVWIEPWGWTWVDEQPWGFAPFHYGRWAYVGNGWVWVPGPVVARPVYAPALVAFVGGGPGAGFALTIGGGPGVAWFPLGPGEVFVPAYRVSPVYVTQINITNTRVEPGRVTAVYNYYTTPGAREVTPITYANRGVPGGVTAVSRETFVSAAPVARNVVALSSEEIARVPVTHVAAAAPVRASVIGASAPASSAPPAAVQQRKVVSNRVPAATRSATTQPASAPVTPPAAVPSNQPARAPRVYESAGPPPTQPSAPAQPVPQSAGPAVSQPAAQPGAAPKSKTPDETGAAGQKPQKQQQKSPSQKSNKPSDKDKEKEKPNPGKP